MPESIYRLLEHRIGRAHLAHRLHMQAHWVSHVMGHGVTYFHLENMLWLHWLIRLVLRGTGIYRRGQHNARRIEIRTNHVSVRDWPSAFNGLTILHLSDLHLDINPGIASALAEAVAPLTYDLCVITGDLRSKMYGPIEPAIDAFRRLRPALRGDIYAVMGNHDFIEMLPPLEAMGVRFLMNESVVLQRGGASVCLAGVDDPHFYETDNIQKAAVHLEHRTSAILLAHSPEIYRKAAACGFDVLLCGHTHAGQICLPGGLPMLINARIPHQLSHGAWRYQDLQGYTSAGAGCSGVDVRFFCRPEVTLHYITCESRS